MLSRIDRSRAASALLLAATLSACSAGGPRLEPPAVGSARAGGAGAMSPAAPRKYSGLVFVSDFFNQTVWVCKPVNGDIRLGVAQPFDQLTGVSNPVQIAIDKKGTIYVANAETDAAGNGSITEYPRGTTSPSRTLTAGLNTTTGVAVDSQGTVFASNKYLATVAVFSNGRSTPSATIHAHLRGPDGLAVDASDNLYIADSSANRVLELKKGSQTPVSLGLSGLVRPTGVAVDKHGNLYVSNLLAQSSNVTVYAPGSTQPSRTIVVTGARFGTESTIGEPVMISIAAGDFLIASAFITLALVDGEWFGSQSAVDGFTYRATEPAWIIPNLGTQPQDTVFQPR